MSHPQVPAPAEPRRAALLGRGPLQQVQRRRADRERGPPGEAGRRHGVRGVCPPPPAAGSRPSCPPGALPWSQPRLHTHREARGRQSRDRARPFPDGEGPRSSLGCEATSPVSPWSKVDVGFANLAVLYAQKEAQPTWRSPGNVVASGPPRGSGVPNPPTGRTWTPGHPTRGLPLLL